MTIVDHTRDHDLAVQGSQAARAWVLHHLLELPGMPTVDMWTVDAALGYLYGTVFTRTDPAEQRSIVEAWAVALKTPAEETAVNDTTTVAVDAMSQYGVRVRISTQLPAVIQEAAA